MQTINLVSLVNAKSDLSPEAFKLYLNNSKVHMKDSEINDILALVENLEAVSNTKIIYNYFYVGFKINQIGKEFDLLRLGDNYNVNIELKSEDTGEKIKKQLLRNQYYLKFLENSFYYFTYIVNENKLFWLDQDSDNIMEVDFEYLVSVLSKQVYTEVDDINSLFEPIKYLVSPFNSTEEFINGEYFLTNQQELIKNEIFKSIDDDEYLFAIQGAAGTGKTLLVYDIVKHYIENGLKVISIHCGNLNSGHYNLTENYNYDIVPAKSYEKALSSDYDLIILDEVQRMWKDQFDNLVSNISNKQTPCIFSYDPRQCLHLSEYNNGIPDSFNSLILPHNRKKLKNKIRTNPEISSFIQKIFGINFESVQDDYSNIEVHYFSDLESAKGIVEQLTRSGWKAINYTTSQKTFDSLDYTKVFSKETAHSVIGQEFDKVIAVIDQSFSYNQENKLIYEGQSYYHAPSMLFQILTRARKGICLVIINNSDFLEKVLNILDNSKEN